MGAKIPRRFVMEHELHQRFGRTIGWMANVINVQQSNPTKRIKGLARLAAEDRVTTCSFTMDYILVDGAAVPWSALEQYA